MSISAWSLPEPITLDDVAAMAAVDERHRYELSIDGALLVMPPADSEHAFIVSRLNHWFWSHGFGWDQVAADAGVTIAARGTAGGRVPDLAVWAAGRAPITARRSWASTDGLLLVIEVVSPGSQATDLVNKKVEYALAGIPRYWIVERDSANTITQYELGESGEYKQIGAAQPLAWVVSRAPELG